MRSSVAFGSPIIGLAAAVGIVAAVSCGGSTPPSKTAHDKESSAEQDKPSDTAPSDDKGSGDDKSEPAASASASGSKEPACSIDTSEAVTSKIGSVKVITGCVSPQKSLKLLEQYYPQLHACFTAELRAHPKGKGEVNIKINVGQSGTYSVRVAKGDITSEEFVKCMVAVLEPLPYPKPEFGGATIELVTQLK